MIQLVGNQVGAGPYGRLLLSKEALLRPDGSIISIDSASEVRYLTDSSWDSVYFQVK